VLSIQSAGSLTLTGTIPSVYTGPSQVPGQTVTGTIPTQTVSGGVLPGFSTTGTYNSEFSGPAQIPGRSISVVANFLTTIQNGSNITIHSPTSDANNVTIGLIGFRIF